MDSSIHVPRFEIEKMPSTIHEFRKILLEQKGYIASPNFLRRTSWVGSISQDTLNKVTGITPFIISVVGIVPAQDLYMKPHGNYISDGKATYGLTTNIFAQAEYKFSLAPPVQFPDFMDDFKQAIDHIRILHAPVDNIPREFPWDDEPTFIQPMDDTVLESNQKVFNFGYPIFRKTGLPFRNESKWEAFKTAIDAKYTDLVTNIVEDYDILHLNVSRTGGEQVPLEDIHTALEGSLVEVQFKLENVYGQGLNAIPKWVWIIEEGCGK